MDSNEERLLGGVLADIKNIREMIAAMQKKDNQNHERLSEEVEELRKEIKSLTRDVTWGKAFIAIVAFLGGIAYWLVDIIRGAIGH